MKVESYQTRFIPQELSGELIQLWHTAKIEHPLNGHARRMKAVAWFIEKHPEYGHTAVYKDLDGLLEF